MPPAFVEQLAAELGQEDGATHIYQFDFSPSADGRYVLDCRTRPIEILDADDSTLVADCGVRVSIKKLQALFEGSKRRLVAALLAGELNVTGDRALLRTIGPAVRRAAIACRVAQEVGNTPGRASQNSDHASDSSSRKWIPDSERHACIACSKPFSLFVRRHHCRMCGEIFCNACSSLRWSKYQVRVCKECYHNVIPKVDSAVEKAAVTPTPPQLSSTSTIDVPPVMDGTPILLSQLQKSLTRVQGTSVKAAGEVRELDRMTHSLLGEVARLNKSISRNSSGAISLLTILMIMVVLIAVAQYLYYSCGKDLVALIIDGDMNATLERIMSETGSLSFMQGTLLIMIVLTSCGIYFSRHLLVRRLRVYYTAMIVFASLKYMKSTEHWREHLTREENEKAWNRVHDRLAKRVLTEIKYLKGFWVKAGQYLSSRADIMPPPWVQHLSKLQDEMPAADVDAVKLTIEQELGTDCAKLFLFFDTEPLGTASIAQVHRAVLRLSNEEVVVKVQHRGIDLLMRQDLVNMERIVGWVAYAEPEFDFKPIMNEWAKVAIDELDFVKEAQNQTAVAANLAKSGIEVKIPKIATLSGKDLVTQRVIVMEYCHGFKVTDAKKMEQYEVDREALMHRICQAYAAQVYVDGVFNCDPHPGNILVSVENGNAVPVLLDFGMTKRLAAERRLAFAKLVFSAASLDFGGLLQAFHEMGLKFKRDDPMEDMHNVRFLLRDTAPPAESRKRFQEFREEKWQKRQQLPRSQRNPVEAWPADLLFFFRVTLLLRGLCSALEVRLRYMSVLKPYAHLAILTSFPVSEHATSVVSRTLQGLSQQRSSIENNLRSLLQQLHGENEFTGVQVAAYYHGELIADVTAGTLGVSDPRPVNSNSLFNCFSVTKAIAALAVHKLVDLGLVEYADPVCYHWPAFAAAGKENITIDHILTHSAGLEGAGLSTEYKLNNIVDWDCMLNAMASATPSGRPGSTSKYHIMSFGWLVGGIVQAVTGQHLRDFVSHHIFGPLGLLDEAFLGFTDTCYPSDRIATLENAFIEVEDGNVRAESMNKLLQSVQGMHATARGQHQEVSNVSSIHSNVRAQDRTTKEATTGQSLGETEMVDAPSTKLSPDKQRFCDSIVEELLANTIGERANTAWKEFGFSKGIRMWQEGDNVGTSVRGHGKINYPMHVVHAVLANSAESKKRWDEKFLEQTVIEEYTADTRVVRQTFAGIWPVQSRDFCALEHVRRVDAHTIVLAGRSVKHQNCPDQSGSVRGEVLLTGFVLQDMDGGAATSVHYLVMIDLKAAVPMFILKQVAKMQPMNVRGLGKECKRVVEAGIVSINKYQADIASFYRSASTPTEAAVTATKVMQVNARQNENTARQSLRETEMVDAPSTKLSPDKQRFCDSIVEELLANTIGERANTAWKEFGFSKGIRMWQEGDNVGTSVRGHGKINYPMHVVHAVLANSAESKKRWDEKFLEQTVIEEYTADTRVVRQTFAGIWPVQSRDFCALEHVRRVDAHTIVLAGRSVKHQNCPDQSGSVRGEVLLTGFVLQDMDGGAATSVHYLVMIDLKAAVPMFILKQVAKMQPMNVRGLGKECKRVVEAGIVSINKYQADIASFYRSAPTRAVAQSPNGSSGSLTARMEVTSKKNLADSVQRMLEGPSVSDEPEKAGERKVSLLMDPCIFNTTKVRKACIPSANGHFSARALAKIYAALANEGMVNGTRILSSARVRQMAQQMTTSMLDSNAPTVIWGRGVRLYTFSTGLGPRRTAFGHAGLGGSIAFCEPTHGLAIAITLNKLTLEGETSTRLIQSICSAVGAGTFIRHGDSNNETVSGNSIV